MSDRRLFRLATTGARVLAGTVVAAVFATAVVTGVTVPWPTLEREPLRIAANPAPADAVGVCAGPLLVLGRDPERADALSVAATQRVVSGTGDAGVAATETALAAPSVPDPDGAAVFTAQPQAGEAAQVAAAGSASVDADDLTGFAASACQAPLMQSWIVAGATTTGSSDLLLLANPGEVPATVQLTVYGATGAQVPPGGSDLVVAAGQQRIVPLAGLLLGEESPVVRVTATGAPIRAALQSSITRTLVPGGVDQTGAVVSAATTQVIVGVDVTPAAADDDTAGATSVVRLVSADADTTATVSAVDQDGGIALSQQVPLTAALPTELELTGLAAGTYSVRVEASAPVVAAEFQSTGLGAGSDFAWYAATPALTADALLAVPEGPDPTLWVVNAGDTEVTVAVEPLSGASATELRIPAGAAAAQPVDASGVYRLHPSAATVHASVSFAGPGALAGMPVWPADSAAGTVVVYP